MKPTVDNKANTARCADEIDAPFDAGRGKRLRWVLISFFIAVLSLWAVTSQWKNFSPRVLLNYIASADIRWLLAAVAAMLGFIAFEGCAIRCACHSLHYHVPPHRGVGYAAADIYFSAITPSASGGQPACAIMMMRDGIPGIVSTAVLLVTLSMYSLSILVIGLLCALLKPSVLMAFDGLSRLLITLGFVAQILLALFFLLLIRSERLLERICRGALHLLTRLHLLRHEERRMEKLAAAMDEYRSCAALLAGHRPMLIKSFLFNLLQRASVISVSMLVYLALGGQVRHALDIFAMQSFAVIGSNCVPIPGAMGVADYLMLDGFNAFLYPDRAFALELLSRSLSFYACVLLCGVTVLIITTFSKRGSVRRESHTG